MDEMTFTLNSPITEEQWDMITDVDFDYTDSITFHTKHGKEVEFVKRKTGKWIRHYSRPNVYADCFWHCTCCDYKTLDNWANKWNFCPNCGAKMEGKQP